MSNGWSWFVIALTALNIAGCWWLLWVNSKKHEDDPKATETMGHVWDGDLEEYNQPLPVWWLMMFYLTIIFAIAYLVLYPGLGNYPGLLGWTQTGQYEQELRQARNRYGHIYDRLAELSVDELANDEQAMGIGQRLYVNSCSVCHGSDARGAPGFPNLIDDDWLYGGDAENILTSVLEGRNGVMPPLGAALSSEATDAMVAYVLSLSGQPHDQKLAAAGASQFPLCAACHGADGRGNQLLGAPNLTDAIWLYDNDPRTIRKAIVEGRSNRMPAHKDLLGAERARIVAAFIYRQSRNATQSQ